MSPESVKKGVKSLPSPGPQGVRSRQAYRHMGSDRSIWGSKGLILGSVLGPVLEGYSQGSSDKSTKCTNRI